MKAKLLKKLRKKFKIVHYPHYSQNYSLLKIEGPEKNDLGFLNYPTFFICRIWYKEAFIPREKDKWDYLGRFINATNDLEEAVDSAKNYILGYAASKYPKLGSKHNKQRKLQNIGNQIHY